MIENGKSDIFNEANVTRRSVTPAKRKVSKLEQDKTSKSKIGEKRSSKKQKVSAKTNEVSQVGRVAINEIDDFMSSLQTQRQLKLKIGKSSTA